MKVMITGASRRLGLFLTEQILEQKHQVIAITRKKSEALNLLEGKTPDLNIIEIPSYDEIGIQIIQNACEMSQVDVLINNASLYIPDNKENTSELYHQLYQVHMLFPALLTECLFQNTKTQQGTVIHLSDIFADDPDEKSALYCSTKAGLENLSKSQAKKYASKLRVNTIQPGPIKFLSHHDAEYQARVLSQNLIKKEGGFAPILKAVNYLIDNDYVTGTQVKVDGGRFLKKW